MSKASASRIPNMVRGRRVGSMTVLRGVTRLIGRRTVAPTIASSLPAFLNLCQTGADGFVVIASSKAGVVAVPAFAVAMSLLCGQAAGAAASSSQASLRGVPTADRTAARGFHSQSSATSTSAPSWLSSDEPGNLGVVVPPAPSHASLPGLCRGFLHAGDPGNNRFRILIEATGGTVGAATAWCEDYLGLMASHPAG